MAQELLNTAQAADWLATRTEGRPPQAWVTWLRNSRNPARKTAFKITPTKIGNDLFWKVADLENLAEFERARELGSIKLSARAAEAIQAMGIGKTGATEQGRLFESGNANLATDNDTGAPIVQLVLASPLAIYRMSPDQAITLGRELIETGEHGKSIGKSSK